MPSVIANICFDCRDAYALVQFWSKVLDLPLDPEDLPGAEETGLELPSGLSLLFLEVPEPRAGKNRAHLCLESADGTRDEEVTRILGLGATMYDDRRQPDGTGWAVLADPEGNVFCVLRNAAERAG